MHGRSVSTVTAYTAHREWATRPPDERYASVQALADAARARRHRTDARIRETVDLRVANTTEIVQRLLAEVCELCGSQDRIQVHHIRALKDLKRKGRPDKPLWVKVMAARRRKTLVVCHPCHVDIHGGRLQSSLSGHRRAG